MKINEIARLAGVTVRTLHYYDEIGLLSPSEVNQSGYRDYDSRSLERLQQIMFFRELDFTLGDIKQIMSSPHYDKTDALCNHRSLLIKKRDRLNSLIALLERTMKGENDMSFKQFDTTELENMKKKYASEVTEKWGNTQAFAESERKTSDYSSDKWSEIMQGCDDIFRRFAECRTLAPNSAQAQQLVAQWQTHITDSFYTCTDEILAGLGQMYVCDERFTQSLDKHGEGTARFMADAIAHYCAK